MDKARGWLRGLAAPVCAVVLLSAPGSMAAPMGPLATPPDIADACKKADGQGGIQDRVKAFWPVFERTLYKGGSGEARNASYKFNKDVVPRWNTYAAGGDAAAGGKLESAWLESVKRNDENIGALSSFQLTLFRCHFPLQSSVSGLDEAAVKAAFEALALGAHPDAKDPNSGRMDGIGGWFAWAAYIESVMSLGDFYPPPADKAAWTALRRDVLLGLLLHAHHDTRTCPGPLCQRAPILKPAGLGATDKEAIRCFAFDPATDAAAVLRNMYRVAVDNKVPLRRETGTAQQGGPR